MKKSVVFILVLGLLCTTSFAQRKYVGWSIGYHTTWGGQSVANMAFRCYTHIAYFAGSINAPSTATGQSFTSTCHTNNTKALLCIGGAGVGGSFTSSTTSSNLTNFITTIVNAMKAQNFDGIDIDWEDNVNSGQYAALIQQLSAALEKITPKPLLTIATGMGLAQYTAPVAAYADQLNLMSYYDYLTGGGAPVPSQLAAFTSRGVAKSKLGLGYGYDTDGEVDVNNPNDIGLKILYTIDNGYGGIMVWEIARACAKCDDTTAYYVNKNATSVMAFASMPPTQQPMFSLVNHGLTGITEIRYFVPSAESVDLGLFDMRGVLVRTLFRGSHEPGSYSILVGRNNAGLSVGPGVYVVKMAATAGNKSGLIVVK
jgi:GH18 family chitinase